MSFRQHISDISDIILVIDCHCHCISLQVTKCTFHNFGASGTIQQFDGLCILPINMINDKIYIGIWFWLFILLLLSIGFMVYRKAVVRKLYK